MNARLKLEIKTQQKIEAISAEIIIICSSQNGKNNGWMQTGALHQKKKQPWTNNPWITLIQG